MTPHYSSDDAGYNVWWSVYTNYVQNGLLLPWNAWKVARAGRPETAALSALVALAAGALLFWHTRRVVRKESLDLLETRRLLLISIGVFFLGYAIFLTNANVQFTPTGIGNRTAIAAALGVSLSVVALSALAAHWVVARWRGLAYSALIAAAGASGCFIVNSVAALWVEAYSQEVTVIRGVAAASPHGPPGTTILLDGVCPFLGPAPVFESSWDFSSAVAFHYRTPQPLSGHVLSPSAAVRPKGFVITHYGIEYEYPYATGLVIYNARLGILYHVPDEAAARHYIETVSRDLTSGCPKSVAGIGVQLY